MTVNTTRARTRTAFVAGTAGLVVTLGVGSAVVAGPAAAATTCPAKEIRKIWDGGTSTVKACEDIPDVLDHLFYPGHMFTTAMANTYSEQVVFIQLRLRDLHYSPLVIDGRYGSQTAGVVKRYQRNHHFIVDGKVGKQTWKGLFGLGPA